MPIATASADSDDLGLCKRCNTNQATLTVRQDALCKPCFVRYVTTKIVKRMETFRVRSLQPGSSRKLLLPLSLGISSTVLLHVLDEHLTGQITKSGRAGYDLHIVHVTNDQSASPEDDPLSQIKERYPRHSYSVILKETIPGTSVEASQPTGRDVEHGRLDISSLLSAVDSSTSRKDIQSVTLRNRLVLYAQESGCEGIIWGDTTTSLAEKVLAETAKGRGFSLPWLTHDGEGILGMPFYFPMRDLLRKELPTFAEAIDVQSSIAEAKTSDLPQVLTKTTTIDGLMQDYFASVEEQYPSIVANVVRTSGKLQVPAGASAMPACNFCHMPLVDLSSHVNASDQDTTADTLCYGCRQSLMSSNGSS